MVRGRNLFGRDKISDSYVIVTIKEQRFKTDIVKKSLDPVWSSLFTLYLFFLKEDTLKC